MIINERFVLKSSRGFLTAEGQFVAEPLQAVMYLSIESARRAFKIIAEKVDVDFQLCAIKVPKNPCVAQIS